MNHKKGTLFVLSGPSGAGKSTIRKVVIKEDNNIWFSISMTTRKPRENEVNNIDYFFVTEKKFKENIKNNNFFEYAEVYKNTFYGTPKEKVINKLNEGIDVILEIDVEGALNIKKEYQEAILIFITPPTINDIKERLIKRNTDSNEKIIERVEKAQYELEYQKYYDYVIENNKLEDAINELKDIINNIRKNKK